VYTKKVKNIFMFGLLTVIFSSCITNKSNTYLQEDKSLPQYKKTPYTYYQIQKNDELAIRVLSLNDEITAIFTGGGVSATAPSYRVYEDGTIDIPFISNIYVEGLTVRQAAKVVEEKLHDFVPDAVVKLGLANDCFYVIGEAGRGQFPLYKEKLNIFQALSLSGNLAQNADKKHVKIIRKVSDKDRPIVKEFDLRTASIIDSEYYYIQPNDVIYVSTIKGDFFKISNYNMAIGSISTTLSFLLLVLGFF